MITTLLASSAILLGGVTVKPTTCPVMGHGDANASVSTVDFRSTRYSFCCNGCPTAFAANPDKYLKNPELKGKTIGTFLFDPVSRTAITAGTASASMEYQGVRYLFGNAANLAKFKKSPATYTAMPAKEVLQCPVANEKLNGYAGAYAYQDVKGVRYFICCPGCVPKFQKEPAKYTAGVAKLISAAKPFTLKAGEVPASECVEK
ncbi:MAG: hypothetical protein JNM85_09430 [Chthonomonas sp.]|nr:hypothetical protein [Chthonomonas sp.]